MILQEQTDQDDLLRGALAWQKKPKKKADKFGEVARTYLGTSANRLSKNALVVDAWDQALPGELSMHCKLTGILGSALCVDVEPGTYMHELRVMSPDLLEYLRNCCPTAKIQKIILRPLRSNNRKTKE